MQNASAVWTGSSGAAYWSDPNDPTQSDRMADRFRQYLAHHDTTWGAIMTAASTADYTVTMAHTGGGIMCLEVIPNSEWFAKAMSDRCINAYIGEVASEPQTGLTEGWGGSGDLSGGLSDYNLGEYDIAGSVFIGSTMADLTDWVIATARFLYDAMVHYWLTLQDKG